MIVDVVTYNGESELFEIRYNTLKDKVDRFIVIEFDKTFSGKSKIGTFNQNWDKVEYYFITEDIWSKYWQSAKESANTNYGKGAEHWIREWCQKESINNCLTGIKDNYIVYIGDCDEIWQLFPIDDKQVFKLKLRVYTYWLNNKSTEEFWGTIVGKYKNIKGKCLNHIRSTEHTKTQTEWGWHFTSLAPYLQKKLEDSYTTETYASQAIINNLENSISSNIDFLGRDFKYKIDESEWPHYLIQHKDKYSQLCL